MRGSQKPIFKTEDTTPHKKNEQHKCQLDFDQVIYFLSRRSQKNELRLKDKSLV